MRSVTHREGQAHIVHFPHFMSGHFCIRDSLFLVRFLPQRSSAISISMHWLPALRLVFVWDWPVFLLDDRILVFSLYCLRTRSCSQIRDLLCFYLGLMWWTGEETRGMTCSITQTCKRKYIRHLHNSTYCDTRNIDLYSIKLYIKWCMCPGNLLLGINMAVESYRTFLSMPRRCSLLPE